MSKDNDIDTVSPKDVYELPDLCEDCGGVPSGKGVLNVPKFYFQQHGDCYCHDSFWIFNQIKEPGSKFTPEQIATQWENMGKGDE